MADIIKIILPTFFAILLGYLAGKFSKINMAAVVDVTLYIGVPALVFVSLVSREIVLLDAARMWAASFTVQLGCLAAAWAAFKITRQKHSGLYVPISMMNTVNIPFPIFYLAYGSEGLAAATLFYIPNVILLYSLGIYLMAGGHWRTNLKEVFRQPVIYAAAAGLLLKFTHINVPVLAIDSLSFIGQMAIPLVLLVLGYNLSRTKMASFPTTLLAGALRMGVGLAIGLAMVWVLNITGTYRAVVILDAAMPAAATAAILASKYQNEAELVSSVVLLTTLVSLVSIPFMLNLLG
jgi:malate permease and related proteins